MIMTDPSPGRAATSAPASSIRAKPRPACARSRNTPWSAAEATTTVEVEVDRLDQIPAVLAGGADTIMLDNFSLDDTRRGVELIDGKAIVEASGNMSLERVPAVAVTGVDVISVGALTHSVRSIDLGLDWN